MNKLLKYLKSNWGYKVIALGISCSLWYLVQSEEILEINKKLDVTILVPEGMVVKGEMPLRKDLTLKASRALLANMSLTPLTAQLNINTDLPGTFRYRLSRTDISGVDERISLIIHDPYISVVVDRQSTVFVKVKEYLQGVPAEGYIVEKTIVKPQVVKIVGLKSEVFKIKEILTEPINIDGLDQSKKIEVPLVPPPGFSLHDLSEKVATINLLIGEKKINQRFSSVPIEVLGSNYKTQVYPKYISIVVQGTSNILSFVKPENLNAFVEVREAKPGKYEKRIHVQIPQNTVLIETFPEYAIVEVLTQKKVLSQ